MRSRRSGTATESAFSPHRIFRPLHDRHFEIERLVPALNHDDCRRLRLERGDKTLDLKVTVAQRPKVPLTRER